MEKKINTPGFKNQEGKVNIGVKKTVAAIAMSVAAILAYDHISSAESENEKVMVIPHIPSNMDTGDKVSKAILDKYDLAVGNKTMVVKVQEKTKSLIELLIEKVSFSKNEKKEEKLKKHETEIDMYLLSRLSKEYLDQNKKEVIGKNNGKAILLAFHKKTPKNRGEIVYLPTPPKNPFNDTVHINHKGVTFSIAPYPKANGYNTEYQISTGGVGEVMQLALLYPSESLEYKNIDAVREAIESKIKEINDKIAVISKAKKTKKTQENQKKQLISLQVKKGLSDKELNAIEKKLTTLQRYEYFSYIPFTERQNTEENQKRGLKYLFSRMKKAYDTTFVSKVSDMPSSITGLTIGEVIPIYFPMILNIIERMDYMDYYNKGAASMTLKNTNELDALMISQIKRSLTTFGLNLDEAFNWQRSRVGATGVGQIMPKTYVLYREHPKYGSLFPEHDFQKGAQNHDTSFRLQIAHFDYQISLFPSVIKQNWKKLMADKETKMGLNAVLAAGYNGNMKRIVFEVFSGLEETDGLGKYKQRLLPKNIIEAMKKQRDEKVAKIEDEIGKLSMKVSGKRKALSIDVQEEIKRKKDEIGAINATYKESSTYVMKTVFVTNHLASRYAGFMQ